MRRRPFRSRKTDYGTIILHWLLVAALVIAVATGLSIGAEAPDRTWINTLARMLPSSAAWTAHRQSAIALVAVSLAYAVYVSRAGLGRRVRLDRVRLLGLLGRSQARWGAINIILYWMFFIMMSVELITGGLLYFGYGTSNLLMSIGSECGCCWAILPCTCWCIGAWVVRLSCCASFVRAPS